jgi:nucleotide-binding universal stress UspA family protein
MRASTLKEIPPVRSVLHLSDFSAASENAFAHALAIALFRDTTFTIAHAKGKNLAGHEWTKFPSVRSTLEKWGLLDKGSPRSAVFDKLAIRVKKLVLEDRNPVSATLEYLKISPTDLIVLATEGRKGLPQWIQPSIAEKLARRSKTMTLFVPKDAHGFVSLADGSLTFHNVLIPVDRQPNPQAAIHIATRAAKTLGDNTVQITLLHVGAPTAMPAMDLPMDPSWSWNSVIERGNVVAQIMKEANRRPADLIVMMTEGHNGFLDALRGSVTVQVLRQAPCPVLTVPKALVDEAIRW